MGGTYRPSTRRGKGNAMPQSGTSRSSWGAGLPVDPAADGDPEGGCWVRSESDYDSRREEPGVVWDCAAGREGDEGGNAQGLTHRAASLER